MGFNSGFKGLNSELNPTFHLLALLGAHHILHVSRIRVKYPFLYLDKFFFYSRSIAGFVNDESTLEKRRVFCRLGFELVATKPLTPYQISTVFLKMSALG